MLIHAHARGGPSTVHGQNQAWPSPTSQHLFLLPPLFLSHLDPQSPFHQSSHNHVCPRSTHPSWSFPRNSKCHPSPQAPKHLLCYVSPPTVIMAVGVPECPLLSIEVTRLYMSLGPMLRGAWRALWLLVSLNGIECLGPGFLPPENPSCFPGRAGKPLVHDLGAQNHRATSFLML